MEISVILKLIIATVVLFAIGYAVYMKMNGIFG